VALIAGPWGSTVADDADEDEDVKEGDLDGNICHERAPPKGAGPKKPPEGAQGCRTVSRLSRRPKSASYSLAPPWPREGMSP
jgi:hypothetical protein